MGSCSDNINDDQSHSCSVCCPDLRCLLRSPGIQGHLWRAEPSAYLPVRSLSWWSLISCLRTQGICQCNPQPISTILCGAQRDLNSSIVLNLYIFQYWFQTKKSIKKKKKKKKKKK